MARKKDPTRAIEDQWKKLKEVIDSIFTNTKEEREEMSKNMDLYAGKMWNLKKLKDYESKAVVNHLFSVVSQIAPLMTDQKPKAYVIPRFAFLEKVARMYNHALSYMWDALDIQQVTARVVTCALLMKVGIFELRHDKSHPTMCSISAVDPRNFFILPGYKEIWQSPMCGVKESVPLTWVRENFPDKKDVKGVTSWVNDKDKEGGYTINFGKSNFENCVSFVEVYKAWIKDASVVEALLYNSEQDKEEEAEEDFPYGMLAYFTEKEFLGVEPVEELHGMPPYVELLDYDLPFDFLGISEADQIKELSKEYNLQLQRLFKHANKYSDPNFTLDASALGGDAETVKNTIHEGGNCYTIDHKLSDNPIIEAVEVPPPNATIYQLLQRIPEDIDEISGVHEINKGQAGKKERQSAMEMNILAETSNTRTRQRIRNLEWSIKRVSYLLVRLMQQYWDKPHMFTYDDQENVKTYARLGNSIAQAADIIFPENKRAGFQEQLNKKEGKINLMEQEERQDWEDYQEFLKQYADDYKLDPHQKFLWDFYIDVQTNSTLPIDKQSQFNLLRNLAKDKIVDRAAVLELSGIPRWQEIAQRMEQKEQEALAMRKSASGAVKGQPGPSPGQMQRPEVQLQRPRSE